ncbi:MAG TPA: RNA pseudouridine synthase [Chryseosolibacter sp.]|nr:RNA pseudouridine synthase [Chryseosolibacter sp.]
MDVGNAILFEDDVIIVVNKPAGLMVEPDRNGFPNLQQLTKKYLKEKFALKGEVYAQHLHRLDRPVSGVVLFAIRKEVLRNLSEQFAQRVVKKYYQAVTSRGPESTTGTLEDWIRKEKRKGVICNEDQIGAEKALLYYNVTKLNDAAFLWDIELHTGKFHQIRSQLSHIGCPIIGDHLYGSAASFHADAIALHARRLIFKHPLSEKEMDIVAEFDFNL